MQNQRFASLFALALSWVLPGLCHGSNQQLPSQDRLELARSLFGREVAPRLFELSRDYVLKLRLDKAGDVISMLVVPKYYFEQAHSEWTEPESPVGMTNEESEKVLWKINTFKSLGSLMTKATGGFVTNSKLGLMDRYQNAFVERRINRAVAKSEPITPDMTHSIYVYFLRRIEGKIQDKTAINQPWMQEQLELKIRGCWYLTTKEEFNRFRIGDRALAHVAGPINDPREECRSDGSE